MAAMTGDAETLDVVEMSVSASAEELDGFVDAVGQQEGVRARLVKRVTRSEAAVLTKLQALVFLVTVVVLLLTMICVSTTMMAVVTERRQEIGLRKALGASDGSIRAEFTIDEPRPRTEDFALSERFLEYKRQISAKLKELAAEKR